MGTRPQSHSPPAAVVSAVDEGQLQREWLEWAAAQIEASLALDRDATERLLAAVDELCTGARGGGIFDRVVASVQVHDRLVQQLTHVAAALRSLKPMVAAPNPGDALAWGALHRRQMQNFSMQEERALFRLLVTDPAASQSAESPPAPPAGGGGRVA